MNAIILAASAYPNPHPGKTMKAAKPFALLSRTVCAAAAAVLLATPALAARASIGVSSCCGRCK